MATIIHIQRYRGDTVPDKITIKDKDGTVVDITSFSFKMSVDETEDPVDEATQLYKLAGSITDGPAGKVEFAPDATEADQTPAVYFYDIEMVDASSAIQTIAKGDYEYLQDITKTQGYIMVERDVDNTTHEALERRIARSERELANVVSLVNKQGENIASILTALETQSKQLTGLFTRTDRPTPWGVIFTGIGVMVMLISLALAPLYRGQDEGRTFDRAMMEHIEEDAYLSGQHNTDIGWLKTMEGRNYDFYHKDQLIFPRIVVIINILAKVLNYAHAQETHSYNAISSSNP